MLERHCCYRCSCMESAWAPVPTVAVIRFAWRLDWHYLFHATWFWWLTRKIRYNSLSKKIACGDVQETSYRLQITSVHPWMVRFEDVVVVYSVLAIPLPRIGQEAAKQAADPSAASRGFTHRSIDYKWVRLAGKCDSGHGRLTCPPIMARKDWRKLE